MLGIANVYLAAEAYAVALALGADLQRIIPIVEESTGRNFWSRSVAETVAQYRAFLADPSVFRTLVGIVSKDLGLIANVTAELDLALPMLSGVSHGIEKMKDEIISKRIAQQWRSISSFEEKI